MNRQQNEPNGERRSRRLSIEQSSKSRISLIVLRIDLCEVKIEDVIVREFEMSQVGIVVELSTSILVQGYLIQPRCTILLGTSLPQPTFMYHPTWYQATRTHLDVPPYLVPGYLNPPRCTILPAIIQLV